MVIDHTTCIFSSWLLQLKMEPVINKLEGPHQLLLYIRRREPDLLREEKKHQSRIMEPGRNPNGMDAPYSRQSALAESINTGS